MHSNGYDLASGFEPTVLAPANMYWIGKGDSCGGEMRCIFGDPVPFSSSSCHTEIQRANYSTTDKHRVLSTTYTVQYSEQQFKYASHKPTIE